MFTSVVWINTLREKYLLRPSRLKGRVVNLCFIRMSKRLVVFYENCNLACVVAIYYPTAGEKSIVWIRKGAGVCPMHSRASRALGRKRLLRRPTAIYWSKNSRNRQLRKWGKICCFVRYTMHLCTHPQTVNTRFSMLSERVDHWHENVVRYDLVVVNPNRG